MDHEYIQFVDQRVTRQKYDEDLLAFNGSKQLYRKQGILLLDDNYPNLYFGFLATKLSPLPIAFAVKINYLNYDIVPLSVTFVNPISFEPLLINELKVHFLRRLKNPASPSYFKLVQAQKDGIPFICFPGIREYHCHGRHTGDFWFIHKVKNVGTLFFILDNLVTYGTSAMDSYTASLAINNIPPDANILHIQANNLQFSSNENNVPF